MPDSKAEVYLHFVWATKWREDTVPPDLERDLYRVIHGEVHRFRYRLLAIGGTANHLHLLVDFGRTLSFARFMEQVKGVSSRFLNDKIESIQGSASKAFLWQPGYYVKSVGHTELETVIAYVRNQKAHHAASQLDDALEPPPDDPDNLPPSSTT